MDESYISNKIAAVVILYNPEETLLSNINTYYAYVNKIYVFDNTESPLNKLDFSVYPKIELYSVGKNRGLAETLNIAADRAIEEGYEWLLTMDQDSYFTQSAFDNYIHCFSEFDHKSKVGVFGPVFRDKDTGCVPSCESKEVDILITSGALLNLKIFNKIGRFDEALFIDSVDHDYCIRTKLAGYSIIQFSTTCMLHELGKVVRRSSIKTLFLVKKEKKLHSPLRCYYMFRNYLYLKNKFRDLDLPVMKVIGDDVYDRIRNFLFYGRNTRILIKYLSLAYKDYKNNKMGKYQDV